MGTPTTSAFSAQCEEIRRHFERLLTTGQSATLETAARDWIASYAKAWREAYRRLGHVPTFDEYARTAN